MNKKNNKKQKRKAPTLFMKVANNIKFFRIKQGVSQERLREETGLSISRLESGKYDMTLTTIHVISKALNIEPYKLLQ